jgi:4-amino-4-deoxychorismate lyase
MSQLFEAIKVFNGELYNIEYHNERFLRSRKDLFGCKDSIDLNDVIRIPKGIGEGLFKCRVIYDKEIKDIEFLPYSKPEIKSLKLIECNDVDYKYKYLDRTKIDELLKQKGECDDILIIKNGLVTDTSIANICFYDGRKWFTPNEPLLKGTKREKLLKEGIVFEEKITKNDIKKFKKVSLINAMLELNLKGINMKVVF